MQATPQQQAVLDAVDGETHNLAVNAVAGASKTTTAIWAAERAGPQTGFVAFNKTIADEMRSRLNGSAQAATMHSLGCRVLHAAFDTMADEPDQRKTQRHFLERFPNLHEQGRGRWKDRMFPKRGFEAVPDLVGICKRGLLNPEDESHQQAMLNAADAQGLDLPDTATQTVQLLHAVAVVWLQTLEDRTSCDFDDMLAMPLHHGLVRQLFRTVFIDEAQDLGPAQREFCVRLGERFVMVGDPRQAIYAFAGADCNSFTRLREDLGDWWTPGCRELPLTWSFRCPTSHAELASLLVPHFETKPGAERGDVQDLDAVMAMAQLAPGDMVVCRNNAPLVSLAYRLIQTGKPVLVRGRAIGDGLRALVNKLGNGSLEDTADALDEWEEKRLARLERRQATEQALQEVRDKASCLRFLLDSVSTRDELLNRIETLFADANPDQKILLSSVHRAKGLERDRVFIWEPGLMPGSADPQELNLIYVAITRSKRSLWFVDDTVRRRFGYRVWIEKVAAGCTRRELTERS